MGVSALHHHLLIVDADAGTPHLGNNACKSLGLHDDDDNNLLIPVAHSL